MPCVLEYRFGVLGAQSDLFCAAGLLRKKLLALAMPVTVPKGATHPLESVENLWSIPLSTPIAYASRDFDVAIIFSSWDETSDFMKFSKSAWGMSPSCTK